MSKNVYSPMRKTLARRTFLRSAGVALGLPLLDAMAPAFARANPAGAAPRRMLAIQTNMGILPQNFFATQAGGEYPLSPYLEILKDFRGDMTVFSGVSHPEVDGGHAADICFLTAAPHPTHSGFKNTISLDQFAAERLGPQTRFPSLPLMVGVSGRSLSWTANGVMIPAERKPSEVYKQLFVQGGPDQVESQVRKLGEGRSILDTVTEPAATLQRKLGPRDRERVDQYFTAVRELERRLVVAQQWERRPKPQVSAPPPTDIEDQTELIGRTRLMFEIARLALETDSTRMVTVLIDQNHTPTVNLPGVTEHHHGLTHHGNQPQRLAELKLIEEAQFKVFADLLGQLKSAREHGASMLDQTMVLYGTCMGSANSHINTNLPVLLAGGGFKHGRHLEFNALRNYPLANLFVSMLQRLGVESDRFASGTGTMTGLEVV